MPSCAYVCKWNGSAWESVGANGTGINGQVWSIARTPNSDIIYAGGIFTTVGGVSANYTAMSVQNSAKKKKAHECFFFVLKTNTGLMERIGCRFQGGLLMATFMEFISMLEYFTLQVNY